MAAPSRDLDRAEHAFRSGDIALAARLLRRVLAAQPSSSKANELLGYVLARQGDARGALELLRKATALPGASASAWYYLGVWHLRNGGDRDAVQAFSMALAVRGDIFEAWHDQGLALFNLGEYAAAADAYDRALAIQPASFEALHNKARAFHQLDRYAEALDHYDRALALQPRHPQTWCNRGATLHMLRRYDEAVESYGQAVQGEAGHADAQWNESLTRLLLGQLETGLEKYEYRWQGSGRGRLHGEILAWHGEEPLEAKRILVWSEQGYGDTIQFGRYVPMIARRGAEVFLEVQPPLQALMGSLGDCTVIARGAPLPRCDYQIPVGSLPRALRTTLDTIPATVPYLSASAEKSRVWKARLGAVTGHRKVGIACSGNAAYRDDRHRPIPLAQFDAIKDLAQFFLVQTEVRESDRAYLSHNASSIVNLAGEIEDFADSAAIVANLDLVISIDTSLAHLAGALGKEVWILLSAVPDWRWLLDRDDNPWYPTARLFRQKELGDWTHPMAEVRQALSHETLHHSE